MQLSTGEKLGPYEILALLGQGGMGEVYRAHDPRVGRDVAIKVSAERFSERFARESRAIASLNHLNVCTLHDVGPNYLVMELVEGEAPEGPLPLQTAVGALVKNTANKQYLGSDPLRVTSRRDAFAFAVSRTQDPRDGWIRYWIPAWGMRGAATTPITRDRARKMWRVLAGPRRELRAHRRVGALLRDERQCEERHDNRVIPRDLWTVRPRSPSTAIPRFADASLTIMNVDLAAYRRSVDGKLRTGVMLTARRRN